MARVWLAWVWGGWLAACMPPERSLVDDPCDWPEIDCSTSDWPPNVLLVIMDDIGTDLVGAYDVGHESPPTPTLDRLAAEGLVLDRAYSYPWCSPTRAALLTGMAPRTVGIGRAIRVQEPDEVSLPYRADTLPERLHRIRQSPWSTALVGKWHLTRMNDGAIDAPVRHGFERFVGQVANLYQRHAFDGQPQDFYDWERIADGRVERTTTYATTQTVDDALDTIDDMPSPWLLWLAFHTAHEPWQPPPDDQHSYGDITGAPVAVRYKAMVESFDTELGRLLSSMSSEDRARTVVMVMGDNGTSGQALTGPLRGRPNKSTVYELGVRVPLLVHWPGLAEPGRRWGGLVQPEDVHATLLHLAGGSPQETEGESFLRALVDPDAAPIRDVVLTESYEPNGATEPDVWQMAARGERFKLVEHHSRGTEFYDLQDQAYETEPLPLDTLDEEAQAALERLSSALQPLRR